MHLVDGTLRPDRHGDRDAARADVDEAKRAELLSAPPFLSPAAKAAFRRVAPLLRDRGAVTKLDRDVLAGLCQAWGELVEAERGIAYDLAEAKAMLAAAEPEGLTPEASAAWRRAKAEAKRIVGHYARQVPGKEPGTWVRNPAVVTAANAAKRMREFAIEFGMTPAAMMRLRGGRPPKEESGDEVPAELRGDGPTLGTGSE